MSDSKDGWPLKPPSDAKYYSLASGDAHAEYGIRRTTGFEAPGEEPVIVHFEIVEGSLATDPVTRKAIWEEELFVRGNVKWDGCCNIDFCGETMAHFCGDNDISSTFKLIEAMIYQLAVTAMPTKHDSLEHEALVEITELP